VNTFMKNFAFGAAFLLLGQVSVALGAPSAAQLKREAFAVVDTNADRMGRLNDAIFSYSEIGFQEVKTIALVRKTLESAGFTVQTGVAGMPTAYMARYGSGSPVIGLMSDYDGIPGGSQKPTSLVHDPFVPGGPGHGEGHNTHQPTLMGAAIAMKEIKDKFRLPGTIVVYGGPAEELVASRGYMTNAGLFKDIDALMDVHVSDKFGVTYGLNNFANVSVQWSFKGATAHSAGNPWRGRSALDGVELMDAGVNAMREHGYNPDDARVHYVIPDGGKQPNVVPEQASVWYYIRAKSPELVQQILDWTREIAQSAATETHTQVTERILAGAWPFNGNEALARVVDKNIQLVGMPKWSADDVAFVRAYQTSMGAKVEGLPTKPEALAADRQGSSTSDAGDISWNVPYVRMWIPTRSSGALAGHHWSSAIGVATPVAHKGIAAGSKALVASMIDLYTDPALLAGIKKDFAAQLARYPKWKSFIPAGATPPTYLNVEEMATYRAALEKFEYDPESGKTYFEFLGLKYPPAVPSSALGKASNEPKPDKTASSLEWHWE